MFAEQKDVVPWALSAKHINWRAVVAAARRDPALSPEEVALHSADFTTNFYGLDEKRGFESDRLNEIHSGGAGLMLLARTALERLDQAYPAERGRFPDAYRHLVPDVEELVHFFTFGREEDGRSLSEDITFCKRWRDIGGRLYAAPWVRTTHVGPHYFRGELPYLLGQTPPC